MFKKRIYKADVSGNPTDRFGDVMVYNVFRVASAEFRQLVLDGRYEIPRIGRLWGRALINRSQILTSVGSLRWSLLKHGILINGFNVTRICRYLNEAFLQLL